MKISSVHLLILALVIGFGLRFYQLGQIPLGLSWDEAVITYDAWGLAEWNRDQYADFLPVVFKSFGDYKPPLMHYILGTVFKVLGLQILAIRVVSAFSGLLLIAIVYFLAKELFSKLTWLSGISALLVAISAWSVHLSRIGFEAHLAITLLSAGVLGFFWGKRHWFWYGAGVLLLAMSLYAYQSTKIVAPLMLMLLLSRSLQLGELQLKKVVAILVFFGMLLIPFFASIDDGALGRGEQALVFFSDDGLTLGGEEFIQIGVNLVEHLSADYLFLGKQAELRNIVPGFGILYLFDIFWLVMGIVFGWKRLKASVGFLIAWIGIGLLPSILSTTSPHTIRSATILPALCLLIGLGILEFVRLVQRKSSESYAHIAAVLIAGMYAFQVVLFAGYYFTEYAIESAYAFQYGYKEALSVGREELKSADKLVVTTEYGQPYIYALLFFEQTPEEFQSGSLANVLFSPISWPTQDANTVYIATPEEIPTDDESVIDLIQLPDKDEVVFVIARTSREAE